MPAITNYQPSLALTTSIVTSGIAYSGFLGGGAAIGMVRLFAGDFGMNGQPLANGQLLQVSQNTTLLSYYGTLFGGDGTSTFGVPDLGGRTIIGSGYGPGLGQFTSSHVYGTDDVAIGQQNLTFHAGGTRATLSNQQPSLGLHYMIQLYGTFPGYGDGQTGYAANNGNINLGVIGVFATDNLPDGSWVECRGQLLSIDQNMALFAILGTTYGGNGQTTFALPDLQGRDIIGAGQLGSEYFTLGEEWGYDNTVTDATMPTNMGGSGQALRNYQPYLAMNYIIALDGAVPSASGSGNEDNEATYAGEIMAFAGNYAPTGFALCQGQILSISGHEHLYAAIGTTYGGNGVTTFALPNLQGRSVIGTDATHLLGHTYGTSTFTLDSSQIPPLNINDSDTGNTLYGGDGDDTIHGNGGNDTINGNSGRDVLYGNGGNDDLLGSFGIDTMYGGAGDDTYNVDDTGDVASEQTVLGVDDGGTDRVDSSVTYTLGAFIEILSLFGFSNINATGNASDNTILGNGGDNVLRGLGGNDRILSGQGVDRMFGGAGDDTYYIDNPGDSASEQTHAGIDDGGYDTVYSMLTYALTPFIEVLTLIGTGAIKGTGNDQNNVLNGNDAANTLYAKGGNDVLDGKGGADRMFGGSGDDTYYVDTTGEKVSEETVGGVDDGGIDTVFSAVTFILGNFVENLTLTGSAAKGTGNSLGNIINGNAAANTLAGLDGNDVLDGKGGLDRMFGGAGNDTYYVDTLNELVSEQSTAGFDDGGTDTVFASVNFILGNFVENLTLTGSAARGTGNSLGNIINGNDAANTLYGNGGNDLLDGKGGLDRMFGGAGNDTYYVDTANELVSEQSTAGVDDGGTDTVFASVNFILGSFVENLTLTDTAAKGTGNTLNNILNGNAVANTISGMDGNDTIAGHGGNDKLTGGNGSDTFVFDHFGAANGVDLVTDFVRGEDHLSFTAADFGWSAGHILTELAMNTASGAGGQFVLNTATGVLSWDSNGAAAGGSVTIATLDNITILSAGDFMFT